MERIFQESSFVSTPSGNVCFLNVYYKCLSHVISHLLYATQIGPKLKNYNGEGFSDDILIATQRSLEKSGATIPDFCQLKSLKKGFQDDDDGLYTNDNRSNNSFEFSYIDGSDSFEDVTATLHRVDSQTPELDAYDDSESKDSSDEEGEDIGPSITVFTNGTFIGNSTLNNKKKNHFSLYIYIVPNNDSNISSGSDYSNDSDSETDDAAQGFIEGHTTQFKNGQMSSYQQGTIAAGNASHTIQKLHEQHRLQSFQSMVQKMQARIRTASVRHQLGEKRREMYSRPEDWIIALQATSRRYLVNKRIRQHQLDMYNQHQERLRNQGHMTADYHDSAYQKLKSEKNPSVGTVKSVIHMLSNSDVDFNEDLVLEDLRQKVIASIRENNQLDHQVSMVDIKIALLLKNAVSLDEVIKLSNAFFNPNRKKQQQRRFSEMVSSNATTNPLDLRGVDKSTRQKVDLYQQLVYLLQTQPYYLAQLMSVTGGQVHGDKKGQKKLEDTVLALFGYGTNAREECLLINLCKVKN